MRTPNFKNAAEFIGYLEDTLIPDLIEAGSDANADDFQEAIHWLKDPVRFAVFLDGGLVQEVYTDRPAQMVKVDLDIEGADECDISDYPDRKNNTAKGFVSVDNSREQSIVEEDPEYVDRLFKSTLPKECADCSNALTENGWRFWKYEPDTPLCDDCYDARMDERNDS